MKLFHARGFLHGMDEARTGNCLLAALPISEWEALAPHLQETDLPVGQILTREGEAFSKVYFPTSGVISTVAVFESGNTVEMATVGREGMVSVAAILESETVINQQVVQMKGSALTMPYIVFRHFLKKEKRFRIILLAYTQAFLAQALRSVACNAVHTAEERAARWLLLCQDRAGQPSFELTQEYLAGFLGVSRPTINHISRALQQAGLIQYKRKVVTIIDRAGLENVACECYGLMLRQFRECLQFATPVLTENANKICRSKDTV
jgi:CRP-like cAMP-binding protein